MSSHILDQKKNKLWIIQWIDFGFLVGFLNAEAPISTNLIWVVVMSYLFVLLLPPTHYMIFSIPKRRKKP